RFLTALGVQIGIAVAKAQLMKEIETAQEQLVQSEKMASIGRLVSSIAHEINNPLTPIVGFSQRLLQRNDLDRQEKESLRIIFNSAQRVVTIIEKLLSFSRESLPVSGYEDINGLIEQSLEFREYQYLIENVEIVKKLDPALPRTMVDPAQMKQVFMNLLLNAEQAILESHGSGRIEIETKLKNNSCIEITISDNGPGIPDDIKGKVFDPFFTTREPGKGTGLGLSVSYEIVNKHGGTLFMKEGVSEGAAFVIDLPVVTPHGEYGQTGNTAGEDRLMEMKNRRVLIVEDEVVMTSLVKTVLEEQGYNIDVASCGREAIRNRDLGQYDLIVCDIRLPDINGMELFKEIKKRDPETASRVFFITGDTSNKTKKFLDRVGNPYLIKPFKIDKLRAHLNEVLAG
ncbi:MAG TPA: response regulator, partial [Thermodesulfobacteriota bacterium]|nr:response regulator [Thermodesulfobacteriota bacterium]